MASTRIWGVDSTCVPHVESIWPAGLAWPVLVKNAQNSHFLISFGALASLLAFWLNYSHLTYTHELYKQNK